MQAEQFILLIPVGLVFFWGLKYFFRGYHVLGLYHLVRNTPTSKIRSLSMGFAEICGVVVPAQGKLLSPLGGKECIYYNYKIEGRVDWKTNKWHEIASNYLYLNFYLRDETGEVLVNLKGAEIGIPVEGLDGCSEKVRKFVMENRIGGGWYETRFTESTITTGDKLYVLGTAGKNPFTKENKEPDSEDIKCLPGKKLLSDDKADYKLEPPKDKLGGDIIHTEKIMIQKGDNNIYYVSNKPENKILNKLRQKVYIRIIGGALIMTGAIWAGIQLI
jgi:hypothetical protein